MTVAPLTPSLFEARLPGSDLPLRARWPAHRHPAAVPQIFPVLDESGEVRGVDGLGEAIAADEAVYWIEGEEDEVESAVGLTALIIEGEHVERFRERSKAAP